MPVNSPQKYAKEETFKSLLQKECLRLSCTVQHTQTEAQISPIFILK